MKFEKSADSVLSKYTKKLYIYAEYFWTEKTFKNWGRAKVDLWWNHCWSCKAKSYWSQRQFAWDLWKLCQKCKFDFKVKYKNQVSLKNSFDCGGPRNTFECGVCKCDMGTEEDPNLNLDCQRMGDNNDKFYSLPCNGAGSCRCGKCFCNENRFGEQCQCNSLFCGKPLTNFGYLSTTLVFPQNII